MHWCLPPLTRLRNESVVSFQLKTSMQSCKHAFSQAHSAKRKTISFLCIGLRKQPTPQTTNQV